MNRYVHSAINKQFDEDDYLTYDDVYDEFIDIEIDVLDELGLCIDFSGARSNFGPIWIFSDLKHGNDSHIRSYLDDIPICMDRSDYISGIESEVLIADPSEWRARYKKYLQSLIE